MPRQVQRYITELLVELLGPAEVEKRYDWCRGDARNGARGRTLPYDAVWEARKLIVEVDERQHTEVVAHFDKPWKLTVSGVHRGEQRRIYDERKGTLARQNGYRMVRIPASVLPRGPPQMLGGDPTDRNLILKFLRQQLLADLPPSA